MKSGGVVMCIAGLLLLSGCAATVSRHAQFIQAEYDPYGNAGTCRINGEAFVRTKGGDIKSSAGLRVVLNPVTTYSTEWWQRTVIDREQLGPPDARAQLYFRETTADGQGKFTFDALPAGRYYVACAIAWQVHSNFWGWDTNTGAVVGAIVKLDSLGQTVSVILKPVSEIGGN